MSKENKVFIGSFRPSKEQLREYCEKGSELMVNASEESLSDFDETSNTKQECKSKNNKKVFK